MGNTFQQKLHLKRVINASGRMSILGVSSPSETVMEAMKSGGERYIEMADLMQKSGAYVAELMKAEAASIVNSASSGIALSVAALVTEGNKQKSLRLHQEEITKNEIIMFKGHNVNYGAPVETMIYLGGGSLVEVGYANEGRVEHLEQAITGNTAGILYVQSHHAVQKNMLSFQEAWRCAQNYNIPLIIDAAAEEDLHKYIDFSDLVIYSGSKAIEGPTSGIVAGKRQYVNWVETQFAGIGRSMKVGKEAVFGLLQAIDEYMDKEDTSEEEKESLEVLLSLNDLEGLQVTIVQDESGRNIYRARMQIDKIKAPVTAEELNKKLRKGEIAIYTRDYGVKQGFFDLDPRPLHGDDLEVIQARIREIFSTE